MNAKTLHIVLDIVQLASAISAAITAQPALQNKPWVPGTLAALAIVATVGKAFTIGNITSSGTPQGTNPPTQQ